MPINQETEVCYGGPPGIPIRRQYVVIENGNPGTWWPGTSFTHDDVINGNNFRVTGPLCGEFTGHRGIPRTKASDARLWYFLWSALEQTMSKQSWCRWFETPLPSLWRHCYVIPGTYVFLLTDISIEIMTWINNHIYIKGWDVITHACPIFNGGLSGHGRVIASHIKLWMCSVTYPYPKHKSLLISKAPTAVRTFSHQACKKGGREGGRWCQAHWRRGSSERKHVPVCQIGSAPVLT